MATLKEKGITNRQKCPHCDYVLLIMQKIPAEDQVKQFHCDHKFPKNAHEKYMFYQDSDCKKCGQSYQRVTENRVYPRDNLYMCVKCGRLYQEEVLIGNPNP